MKMRPFLGYFVRGPVRSGWLVGLVQKYGSSVVFISNGKDDDECGVRKPLGGASLPMNRDSPDRDGQAQYSNLYK